MEKQTVVVASGYFSPIHSGHIKYLEMSKSLGDVLIVVVNNDNQERLKKGSVYMDCVERMRIIKALSCVDMVVESVDQDRSICTTLSYLRPDIFTNGGDQFNDKIPEIEICKRLNIRMTDGLGEKKMSSSEMIARAKDIGDYKLKVNRDKPREHRSTTSDKEKPSKEKKDDSVKEKPSREKKDEPVKEKREKTTKEKREHKSKDKTRSRLKK